MTTLLSGNQQQVLCPYCGAESRLLFNILACSTPNCRNYDEAWANEWFANHGPRFTHSEFFGSSNHKFLGRYTGMHGSKYDLYTCQTFNSVGATADICIARFGNLDEQAYYVDAHETEIGIVGHGPVHNVSADIKGALKHALDVYKKRRSVLKKKP